MFLRSRSEDTLRLYETGATNNLFPKYQSCETENERSVKRIERESASKHARGVLLITWCD